MRCLLLAERSLRTHRGRRSQRARRGLSNPLWPPHDELSGAIDLAAPEPLPQREFMRALREAWGVRVGLPATGWMASVGAWAMGTDPELVMKSRRVIPGRLTAAGFTFLHPTWAEAAKSLAGRR